LVLTLGSLALNFAYSVPPLRLCTRSLAAPVLLALAYVALPYGMGLAAVGLLPDAADVRCVASFAVLFLGRMLLKDFRDLPGDAAFGKRTFLLAHGKKLTLAVVLACVLAGNALLLTVLPSVPLLAASVEACFAGVLVQLYRLWRAAASQAEQLAIAIGARFGNAVVLTLLGALLLLAAGAPVAQQAAFVIALTLTFWGVSAFVMVRPEQVRAAYRG
jgi:4-hydroxybenzoate polyprenyltransferase